MDESDVGGDVLRAWAWYRSGYGFAAEWTTRGGVAWEPDPAPVIAAYWRDRVLTPPRVDRERVAAGIADALARRPPRY